MRTCLKCNELLQHKQNRFVAQNKKINFNIKMIIRISTYYTVINIA